MTRTQLVITLDLENAAFDPLHAYSALAEVKRTITEALDRLDPIGYEQGEPDVVAMRDYNGNRVGEITLNER